ncbi:MAG: hypothetical protein ACPHCJ_10140, partial [Oceanococcaceae bacterium]
RARHAPDTLSPIEAEEWKRLSRTHLEFAPAGGLSMEAYMQEIQARAQQASEADKAVLRELWRWGQQQAAVFGLEAPL